MANISVVSAMSAILTVLTVDTVSCTRAFTWIVVKNRSTTAEIWVRVDGVDPTVGGDEAYVVLPLGSRDLHIPDPAGVSVKVISAAAAAYAVEFI